MGLTMVLSNGLFMLYVTRQDGTRRGLGSGRVQRVGLVAIDVYDENNNLVEYLFGGSPPELVCLRSIRETYRRRRRAAGPGQVFHVRTETCYSAGMNTRLSGEGRQSPSERRDDREKLNQYSALTPQTVSQCGLKCPSVRAGRRIIGEGLGCSRTASCNSRFCSLNPNRTSVKRAFGLRPFARSWRP